MVTHSLKKSLHYHVYNRGVSQRKIFLNEADYRFFMYKIAFYKLKYSIELITYCLMPNHFHLLLKSGQETIKVSKFMHGLQLSYAKYFNRNYSHKGHVFESRYHFKEVVTPKSLMNVIDYIRQNPVKKKLVVAPEEWPYLT
ncbi:transposase [Patescibacteria group bacterium]